MTSGADTLHYQIDVPEHMDGRRLDQALAELFPDYSRSRLKQWILSGHARLDGETTVPKVRVRAGQSVSLEAEVSAAVEAEPQAIALNVVFEDEHVLVIDKPAGLVVHPGAGNADGTLMNGLLHRYPDIEALPRAGILHRLDKNTTGLLMVAKTVPAHTHLNRALQNREILREYRAVCQDRLTAGGAVDAPIGRHPTQRTKMAVSERGKGAVTHYRVLARFTAHTLLGLRLETGRTHQIRVHMAHARHPLLGDPVYGARLKIPAGMSAERAAVLRGFRRQALHAGRIEFMHPIAAHRVTLESRLPEDFMRLLKALQGDGTAMPDFDALRWPD